jgi:glycosyltransferase involved in cell wall biosynthesis
MLYFLRLQAIIFFLNVLFLSAAFSENSADKEFVVVIPSYNNSDWYIRNLDSVFSQNYPHFRVVYVDDCSPDHTAQLVKKYIEEKNWESDVILIENKVRIGSLANFTHAIALCKPHEIVVQLDGDDWLAHENVLSHLNQAYADPDVWVTYGQFTFYLYDSLGWCAEVPKEIIEKNAFREYPWVTSHLRTFYAGLFQKIKTIDLLHDGKFYPMAGDLAFMFPILEMAGTHSRFIPEVLYIYNFVTPINDAKTDQKFQEALGFEIRRKARYLPIDKPY